MTVVVMTVVVVMVVTVTMTVSMAVAMVATTVVRVVTGAGGARSGYHCGDEEGVRGSAGGRWTVDGFGVVVVVYV